MPNGNNPPGHAGTDASISKPPQFVAIVAGAAAVGAAIGAIVAKVVGAG